MPIFTVSYDVFAIRVIDCPPNVHPAIVAEEFSMKRKARIPLFVPAVGVIDVLCVVFDAVEEYATFVAVSIAMIPPLPHCTSIVQKNKKHIRHKICCFFVISGYTFDDDDASKVRIR